MKHPKFKIFCSLSLSSTCFVSLSRFIRAYVTWVYLGLQVERVSHRDNFRTFVQKSENLEKQCLSKAIRYYCELRVLPFVENKTVVFWFLREKLKLVLCMYIQTFIFSLMILTRQWYRGKLDNFLYLSLSYDEMNITRDYRCKPANVV